MKVLVLSKYGSLAASTRYRFTQFFPYLETRGIYFTVSPLLSDGYLRKKFSSGRSPLLPIICGFFRRAWAVLTARRFDCVIIHCEAFPYLPPFFEKILHVLRVPYIYDFDDAIFHQYDRSSRKIARWAYRKKIASIIGQAANVFAGNTYLADYARSFNAQVHIIPTVVDSDRYKLKDFSKTNDVFTIGWIGSPSTAAYLRDLAPMFKRLALVLPFRLVLIGSGPFVMEGVPIEVLPWREDTEIEELRKFDVGIMPLPDTDWARGKCGFKIIQYMACGVPAVASPVGVNRDLIENAVDGYLAQTEDEWLAALQELQKSREKRMQMGNAGHSKVRSKYSLSCIAPRLAELILPHRPLGTALGKPLPAPPTQH
jgi:glycosyltransferase involved in cell wall biosynthesis